MKNLRRAFLALFLSASVLSPLKGFSEKEVIFNEKYSVPVVSETGDKSEEEVNITASVDSEENILYLGVYPKDYDRKDWIGDKKMSLPVPDRYSKINYAYSKMFILKPQRVKIEETEQRAYTIPKHRWSEKLEPYERSQLAQLMVETGEDTIKRLFSAIPYLNRLYDKFLRHEKELEDDYYKEIFDEINEDYIATRIFPNIPKDLIGQTETAREYIFEFDTGNTQDEIPVFLWMRIAIGDPSNASYGSPPNKYGELENILIRFNLNQDKIKREELYDYFFHEEELDNLNISKDNIEGTKSNPAVITVGSLDWAERLPYEKSRIVRIGKGKYILQETKYSAERDLLLKIIQFETGKDREEFLKEKEVTYPYFFKSSVLSSITSPTLKDVFNPLEKIDEEQMSFYFDLILNYANRTGMEIVLSEKELETESILKAIKEQQLNSGE